MSPYEFLLMIYEECEENAKETILALNQVILDFGDERKSFTNELTDVLEDWALQRGLCCLCGEKIIVVDKDYFNYEYQGQEGVQPIDIYGCEYCSYIVS